MEACDECKKDCLLIHGKRVPSFSKVMTDKSFLQVLLFPPKFAQSVSHLTDQETYLEDSSGLRWRVTVCNHNGSLAIQQGWPEFSSEHGLNVGDLLVFHYVPNEHFLVQIFGTSDCEKIIFCCDIGKGKKRARAYAEETTPVDLLPIDINSIKKKSKPSESEKPNITTSATDIDADPGKGQSAISVDESFGMVDRDHHYDQEDGRLCLHLSSFEMPASKPLAQGTNSRDNGNIETNLTEPNLDVEMLPKFEAGTDMASKPAEGIPLLGPNDEKSKEASQFDSGEENVNSEPADSGEEYVNSEPADSGEEYANSESADSGHPPSRNTDNYSCLVIVDGRDFQELPESWRNLFNRPKRGRWIIFLQGLDKRIWPVFYRTRPGFDDVLTSGWEQVTAAYDLNAGDFCLFELVNRQEHIFGVRKL